MKYLNKLAILFICTLSLTGCSSEFFVSQTPRIADFIGKTPEQIYRQAEHALNNKKYSTAISCFRVFIKLYPDHPKAETARLTLVKCYTARGQFKEALKEIEDFIFLYPQSSHCDNLKRQMERLSRKAKMDRFYHVQWSKDIKSKNKTGYEQIVKKLDQLKK